MRASHSAAIRYAFVIGGPVAIGPFMALWLRGREVDLRLIGPLIATPLFLRVLLYRPLACWVARYSTLWTPVAILCGVACLCSLVCVGSSSGPLAITAWWCVCLTGNACVPLMDSAILDDAPDGREDRALGFAKGAGAVAYLLAVPAVGTVARLSGPSAIPLWSGFMALGAGAFAAAPMTASLRRGNRLRAAPLDVLDSSREHTRTCPGAGRLLLILAGAALIEGSHGLHAVAMVTWADRGIGPDLCGLLWASGPLADIAFLGLAGSLRRRLGPVRMIVIGGAAAVVRWAGFAATPSLPSMFMLQALHALSFTATYLGSVEAVHLMSQESRTSRQIANWAIATGLAGALGSLCSGAFYGSFGLEAYWFMAASAAVGLSVVAFAIGGEGLVRPISRKASHRRRLPLRKRSLSRVLAGFDKPFGFSFHHPNQDSGSHHPAYES